MSSKCYASSLVSKVVLWTVAHYRGQDLWNRCFISSKLRERRNMMKYEVNREDNEQDKVDWEKQEADSIYQYYLHFTQ